MANKAEKKIPLKTKDVEDTVCVHCGISKLTQQKMKMLQGDISYLKNRLKDTQSSPEKATYEQVFADWQLQHNRDLKRTRDEANATAAANERIKTELGVIRSRLQNTEVALTAKSEQVETLETTNKQLRGDISKLKGVNSDDRTEIAKLRVEIGILQAYKRAQKRAQDLAKGSDRATEKIMVIENNLNNLRQQNRDLCRTVSRLSIEKNELHNLTVTLESKIQKYSDDLEQLTALKNEIQNSNQIEIMGSKRIMNEPETVKDNEAEKEEFNLIRQIEFLQQKLFISDESLRVKDSEINALKDSIRALENKCEMKSLEGQEKCEEINATYKNKAANLYQKWKNMYNELEERMITKDNEYLDLSRKYSELENLLLYTQHELTIKKEFQNKYECLDVKYNALKIKHDRDLSGIAWERNNYKTETSKMVKCQQMKEHECDILQEKVAKLKVLVDLEVRKNQHLKQKCADMAAMMKSRDDQIVLSHATVENQILERQRLYKEIELLKNGKEVFFQIGPDPQDCILSRLQLDGANNGTVGSACSNITSSSSRTLLEDELIGRLTRNSKTKQRSQSKLSIIGRVNNFIKHTQPHELANLANDVINDFTVGKPQIANTIKRK